MFIVTEYAALSSKQVNKTYFLQSLYSLLIKTIFEPRYEICNNVVSAISKVSDQPAHTRSLISLC